MNATSETAVVDGTRVRHFVAGEGPPVVLLHGGGVDAAAVSWRHVLPSLAAERTVYAPDWPGYGESDAPAETPTVAYYVDVLDDLFDELAVDEAVLVGVSMGGGIALGTALDRPERVSRLALVDSYGLGGTIPAARLAAWFSNSRLSPLVWKLIRRRPRLAASFTRAMVHRPNMTPALAADVVREAGRPTAGEAWRAFQREEVRRSGLRTNYLDRLPDLPVPTLVVHGERDPLIPVEWAVRAGSLIPDAEVRILPECGHWTPRERPERLLELLRGFR